MSNALHNVTYEQMSAQDDERFNVNDPIEIIRVLRSLMQQRAIVTAYFNEGQNSLITAIIDVHPEAGIFLLDYSANETLNQSILTARKVYYATSLGSVKVQFVADNIESTIHQGLPAFSGPLPLQISRIQRRDYHRLSTPTSSPITCAIKLSSGKISRIELADIALSGLGLLFDHAETEGLRIGMYFSGCSITLPDVGTIEVTLSICNQTPTMTKSGAHKIRLGCKFVDLSLSMEAKIQRYMTQLERERLAKQSR